VEWERLGRPVPPPHPIKQEVLRDYGRRHHLSILVETGTYVWDMVEALKGNFERIYTIELSDELHGNAKRRFSGERNVTLIRGDSGIELGKLMGKIDRPALFWLDGHYSSGVTARAEKETPIFEELRHLLEAPDLGHVIVIDDARCFGSFPDYPTIDEVKDFVRSKRKDTDIVVQDDIIRITPRA
jgi:hypothetical protein